jgi:putative ABC transport system ATP-binding protein
MNNGNKITLKKIKKVYHMGTVDVHALRGVDLRIESGELVAVMGASGSGKSTLMNIIGALDYPSGGSYTLDGVQVNELNRSQLADIRNQKIGFVFQGYNLLSRATALENVELPLLYDRRGRIKNPRKRAIEALERVGLGDRLFHEPNQLSGGQQQRVAIARALVNQPAILLADEPTGNLDSKTSIEVMTVFQELNRQGITILLVTHEADIALYARRIVVLQDGLKIKDEPVQNRRSAVADLNGFVEPQEVVNGNGEGLPTYLHVLSE